MTEAQVFAAIFAPTAMIIGICVLKNAVRYTDRQRDRVRSWLPGAMVQQLDPFKARVAGAGFILLSIFALMMTFVFPDAMRA